MSSLSVLTLRPCDITEEPAEMTVLGVLMVSDLSDFLVVAVMARGQDWRPSLLLWQLVVQQKICPRMSLKTSLKTSLQFFV